MRTERGGVAKKKKKKEKREKIYGVVPSCRGIRAMLMEIHRSFFGIREKRHPTLSIFAHFKHMHITYDCRRRSCSLSVSRRISSFARAGIFHASSKILLCVGVERAILFLFLFSSFTQCSPLEMLSLLRRRIDERGTYALVPVPDH